MSLVGTRPPTVENLFKSKLQVWDRKKMIYSISMERKGYHYPQRNINQYIQIFGRTVTEKDVDYLREKFRVFNGDSIAILSNKIINISQQNNIVMDSIEDFYYHWENYINGGDKMKRNEKQEIVISGAFPDCDEIYKQSLTDALIKFAKVIVRESFVSYLMGRRKLLIVQKMKIDQECQKKQYKNICILN